MPPGPAYNWYCVLASAADVLSNAARIRAAQVASASVTTHPTKRRRNDEDASSSKLKEDANTTGVAARSTPERLLESTRNDVKILRTPNTQAPITPIPDTPTSTTQTEGAPLLSGNEKVAAAPSTLKEPVLDPSSVVPEQQSARHLQSSKVPSSRLGRLFHYGGLAASLGYGAATELIRRAGSQNEQNGSVMMTEANIKRLVSKLSEMRGAALKLGQFMSIQDTHILPPEVDNIFRRVQDSAHYMPDWQMEKVVKSSLGEGWLSYFDQFDRIPFAAASIGQVHNAVLSPSASPTRKAEPVAVKIQFPNIADSIESDLGYIKLLLTASALLPKGLFLDRTMQVMKEELADECDYEREAHFLRSFRAPEFLGHDTRYKVPWVWEGSTKNILVMERVDGASVGEADQRGLSQRDRNDISTWVMELCLKELFEFRTMQTDPNWTNFLWNPMTRQIELIDFGATRTYSKEFMDSWLRLLLAAASENRQECIDASLKLGYLTGEENELMLDAHVTSMILLAAPFKESTKQPFSFGPGSHWSEITNAIREQIPTMLRHRLTPPPRETYSLNRKLSGSFLLASRLGATIDTKAIWDKVIGDYKFTTQ